MPTSAVVRANVDEKLKQQAEAIYAEVGLTLSDAFRMLLVRTVSDRRLPFEPFVPNAVTVEAMREAERGGLQRFKTVEELLSGPQCGRLNRQRASAKTSNVS